MMNRAHNFSAGPAVLPVEVLEETSKAVLDFEGLGMSIMEVSHRSKEFDNVVVEAQKDCLDIMGLPQDEYSVLFLGGGASTQFLMVPMNFLKNKADYVNTGAWSKKAIKEAKFVGQCDVVASSEETVFNFIPKDVKFNADADYVHITTNNTIYGTEYHQIPDVGNVPLVADMSSDIFARQLDFSKFNLIYAGAQKNIGPAGVTLVVIKNDWLENSQRDNIATMLNYKTHTTKDSMFNTPPCLPIFVVGKVFKWIQRNGGLAGIQERNEKKAKLIYDFIDANNDFFKGHAKKEDRSLMNVTWNLPTPELEAQFVKEAREKYNMTNLKGHRSVGGNRASIYNACPYESVEALVKFMEEFMKANK
jgi:phosphoserine aminotransferase